MVTYADRVKETSTTTGTGSFTLAGSVTGFRTFASIFSVSDTMYYVIDGVNADGSSSGQWEVGQGTLSGATTLARTRVIASSNAGSAVNFSSGTKYVYHTVAAEAIAPTSPGGSTTQVQYNEAGAFAGDSGFTYSSSNKAITLGGATVTASAPVLNLSQTWNSGGTTFTGLKLNVTDTASASASLLMDLQVGGSSKARLGKLGNMFLADAGTTSLPALAISATNSGIYSRFGGVLTFVVNGGASAEIVGVGSEGLKLNASSPLTWSSSGISGVSDVLLYRDAANTLALRNSTSAQTFNWYFSYTDGSNYARGALKTASGYVEMAAETAGTGADNINVKLTPAGTGTVQFGTHSAIAAETVTGYITITDAGGTTRKLAVVS